MKKLRYPFPFITIFLSTSLLLTSCIPSNNGAGKKSSSGGGTSNTTYSVKPTFGRYLTDNPIALTGDTSLASSYPLGALLSSKQTFITNYSQLISPCSGSTTSIAQCLEVRQSEYDGYTTATDNRWAFNPDGLEFLEVQTFGNMRDINDKFQDYLEWGHTYASGASHASAIPSTLYSSGQNAFWFFTSTLKGYSNCGIENNAYYDPAARAICLGQVPVSPTLYIAEDPTVTYHEMGHVFVHLAMNMRHRAFTSTTLTESSLGSLFYDEAGAINEGLADFYSYFMTGRTHFGEWALGRYLLQSRPMIESDSLHAAGIDTTAQGRLSYPNFLNYDPNEPETPYEDIHYAGQITSHFLTAFHRSLEDSSVCGMSSNLSLYMISYLLNETMAELGDQTSTGTGGYSTSPTDYNINLNPDFAFEWLSKVNPINYRRFYQTFAKYVKNTVGNSLYGLCNGSYYSSEDLESLLDQYGLLLFRTYNDNGNNQTLGHSGSNTTVDATNRVQTTFTNKSLLKLDSRTGSASAYVIDSQADISAAVESLILSGQIASISNIIDSDFAFNNGNAQISPGEVVALAINLYNSSNTTMGGVQVLANDWDHTKGGKPCNNLGDEFPLESEGAADLTTGEGVEGGCDYTTRYNGNNTVLEPNEEIAPVCLVELPEDDATQWVTQNKMRKHLGLSKSECLGGEDSLDDCLIRSIKGADHAYFSKIEPQKNWLESLQGEDGEVPSFNTSNVLFFEISPWIPPGTTFNCRLRARFTNCDDCYHDSTNSYDDYLDYEFSGAKPFKIINFKFTVID